MTSNYRAAGQPGLGGVPGVRSGLAAAGLFALVPVAQATHISVDDALVVAAVLTAGAAALLPLRHALLLAVTAWGLLTGFVVNSAAQLTLGVHDVGHLVVLVGVAVAGVGLRITVEHPAAASVHPAHRVHPAHPVHRVHPVRSTARP